MLRELLSSLWLGSMFIVLLFIGCREVLVCGCSGAKSAVGVPCRMFGLVIEGILVFNLLAAFQSSGCVVGVSGRLVFDVEVKLSTWSRPFSM